jgi:hypothetical protein
VSQRLNQTNGEQSNPLRPWKKLRLESKAARENVSLPATALVSGELRRDESSYMHTLSPFARLWQGWVVASAPSLRDCFPRPSPNRCFNPHTSRSASRATERTDRATISFFPTCAYLNGPARPGPASPLSLRRSHKSERKKKQTAMIVVKDLSSQGVDRPSDHRKKTMPTTTAPARSKKDVGRLPKPHGTRGSHRNRFADADLRHEELDDTYDDADDEDDATMMAEVDALQALNTALCFLVSINADATCVEEFLLSHPGALLLEGTGHVPEESASHILEAQMGACQCFSPLCQSNRRAVQKLLDRGFEHYSSRRIQQHHQNPPTQLGVSSRVGTVVGDMGGMWTSGAGFHASSSLASWDLTAYGHRMRVLERNVRIARRKELRLRHRILEAALHVRDLVVERRRNRRREDGDQSDAAGDAVMGQQHGPAGSLSKSIWTLCTQRPSSSSLHDAPSNHGSSNRSEGRARISAVEYELRMAQLRLSSVEREHAEQLRQIRSARRFQFGILKRSFEDCRRHVCLTAIANATTATTTAFSSQRSQPYY